MITDPQAPIFLVLFANCRLVSKLSGRHLLQSKLQVTNLGYLLFILELLYDQSVLWSRSPHDAWNRDIRDLLYFKSSDYLISITFSTRSVQSTVDPKALTVKSTYLGTRGHLQYRTVSVHDPHL